MNPTHVGILLGGLLPAVIFGICGLCLKASNQQGIGPGYCLLFAGVGAIAVALVSLVMFSGQAVNAKSATQAFLVGATWAGGLALMAMAMTRYRAPISVLGPLTSTACLVTAAIALWWFSEWKDVRVARLLAGAVLIVAGAMLVSTSPARSEAKQLDPPGDQARAPQTMLPPAPPERPK